MDKATKPEYLVEITLQQKFTLSVQAENPQHAIELANSQYSNRECELPPEILVEKTRVVQ